MSFGPLDFQVSTRVLYGPGLARQSVSALLLPSLELKRVLIVTDPGVMGAGLIKGPRRTLEQDGMEVRVFHQVAGEPTAALIDQVAGVVREFDPQAVIGLGGGSSMDAAKLAAAAAEKEQTCRAYIGCTTDLPPRNRALVMIPTTSGTGAEVTRTVILSDGQGRKMWAWGDALAPDLALLDPELTLSLPSGLTAATGLDALVHALEAATAQRSNPFALAFARQALYLGGPGLGAVLDDPRDLEARGRMMMAACLAGLAIDQAGTGLAHAMGHALGNLAHLPHGAAVALAEAVVLPFNAAHEPRLHGLLFQDLGWPGAGAWTALLKRCSLDGSLIREALDPSRAGELAETCLAPENRPMVENNSRPVDRRQLDGLIRNLWEF